MSLLARFFQRALAVGLVGLAFSGLGQEQFLVEMWDVERGLPSSTVSAVMQAADGYLWLSTLNGLARFDGVRFRPFVGPWTSGMKVGGYNSLAIARPQSVWALAEDGDLVRYNRSGFTTIKSAASEESVQGLYSDSNGGVWASLRNGALAWCAEARIEILPGSQNLGGIAAAPTALPDGSVWFVAGNGALRRWKEGKLEALKPPTAMEEPLVGVAGDSRGSLWVLGAKSLWEWHEQQWTPVALPDGFSAPLRGVKTGPDKSLWIWDDKFVWRLGDGTWRAARVPDVPVAGFQPTAQMMDSQGRAWFGTRDQGLLSVNAAGQTTLLTVRDGLPSNFIRCLALDHEGNLWAGTSRGLIRIKPKQLNVISWEEKSGEAMATGIATSPDDTLWIGTYGSGLLRYDGTAAGSLARVFSPTPKSCRAVLFDASHQLWVGTVREGLWTMNRNQLSKLEDVALPDGESRSLLKDSRGRLWIGTTKGLFSWSDGKLIAHPNPPDCGPVDARTLVEAADGAIWVGTQSHGLFRIQNGGWERLPRDPPAALLSIWSLLRDSRGDLWIGTQGGGLARWRASHLDWFNAANGLPAYPICSLLEDDQDHLWLGTYQGIFRVSKGECEEVSSGRLARLEPQVFTKSDGMPTLQCTGSFQPTACRMRDGRLCFPTIKGVVIVDPRQQARPAPPPSVVIEEVLLPGRSMSAEPGLRLGPHVRRLEFRFTALSFSAPERVRFRYRLQTEDRDWIEAGTERTATFNVLAPGRYTFQVTACNGDGVWSKDGASLAFTVLPAWYEWRWLQITALGCVLTLAAAVWRRVATQRLQARLEQARRQGALERERARIAQDIHDELGTSLTRIIMLSQPGDSESDPPSPELSRIHATARSLTRAMDEVVWAVNPRQDTLEGLLSYTSVFVQDFLSSSRIGCRLDLPDQVPAAPLSAEVRHNVFLAVKEAVHNAVRHSHGSEVRLALHLESAAFTLEVIDNGAGFDVGALAPAVPSLPRARAGHGLVNMRERLTSIGGKCEICSNPGRGTTVRFTVPCQVWAT